MFIQGYQADSVTFSLEKMINATIYIGTRRRKRKALFLHKEPRSLYPHIHPAVFS